MNDFKGIPPEWVENMHRLGIRPDDEYFFLVRMLNETGMSMTKVGRAVAEAGERYRTDLRENANILRGEFQAIADTGSERLNQLLFGSDGKVGAIPAVTAATRTVTDASSHLNASAAKIEQTAERVERAANIAQKREWKCFWLGVLVMSLLFFLIIGVLAAAHLYRLDRVVATHNAPEIVRAYAEAFARHPLPDEGFNDSLETGALFKAYEDGIGKMPPQLAYTLASAFLSHNRMESDALIRLKIENAKLKQQLAERSQISTVALDDGSVAVRVPSGGAIEPFLVIDHKGYYVRIDLRAPN